MNRYDLSHAVRRLSAEMISVISAEDLLKYASRVKAHSTQELADEIETLRASWGARTGRRLTS